MVFCSECGHKCDDPNARFCPECGSKLNVSAPNPTPAPAPAPAPAQQPTKPVPSSRPAPELPQGFFFFLNKGNMCRRKGQLEVHGLWQELCFLSIFLFKKLKVTF